MADKKTDKPETEAAAAAVPVLKRKELIARVTEQSGAKKKDVKVVVEATLKVLGDALAAGETLALPPFGKAKVNRHKELGEGEMLTVKLRRGGAGKARAGQAKEALEEPAE